jgi:hypothetical protein
MRIAPFLAIALAATPAFAGGDNVVMVAVAHVAVPQKLPGLCRVEGTITHVWEGRAFQEGQTLILNVPCGDEAAGPLPPATAIQGPRLTDPVVLKASTLGAAHIDDDGNLLWQPVGADREVIWGYRVLSPVRLRLGRSA